MPPFSLFQPMPGLPLYLWPVWPLIYWRILRLKAWFRANGSPGSQMLWGVTRDGRVVVNLLSDDLSGYRPPQSDFGFEPTRHFREAIHGQASILTPDPCPRRKPGPHAIRSGDTARDPRLHREYGHLRLIPLPDT